MTITVNDVLEAKKRIATIATRTPLKRSIALTKHLARPVALKMETMQATGAFKLRGATNAILSLAPQIRGRGVVTASSGNHGRAIAYVARELGIPAAICVSELVPESKISAMKSLDATVHVVGKDQDAAMIVAHNMAETQNMTFIGPFDEVDVIAGQATIGLEILEDNPEIDTLVIPVSGGGLAAGIAFVVKTQKPSVKIIGVTMEKGAAMYHSINAGKPTFVEELPTIADALQGGIGLNNRYSFAMCREYVDEFMLINDEQIMQAMTYAYRNEHLVLEGSGACGIGLLLDDRAKEFGGNVVTICSGDNIDPDLFSKVVLENTI
jgi:threonine dehydratase